MKFLNYIGNLGGRVEKCLIFTSLIKSILNATYAPPYRFDSSNSIQHVQVSSVMKRDNNKDKEKQLRKTNNNNNNWIIYLIFVLFCFHNERQKTNFMTDYTYVERYRYIEERKYAEMTSSLCAHTHTTREAYCWLLLCADDSNVSVSAAATAV